MLAKFCIFLIVLLIVVSYVFHIAFPQFDIIATFLSEASGAALGGFVGALIVWFFRERFVSWRKKPEHIVTYYVADNKEEIYGKLLHQKGHRIENAAEIKRILGNGVGNDVINNGIWEWTKTDVVGRKGTCAFYGPYAFDLTEPGTYEASFHFCGTGFDASNAKHNQMLFHVDVLLRINMDEHIKRYENGKEVIEERQNIGNSKNITKNKKYLYYKDFVNKNAFEWKVVKLRFYFDGTGNFEYRAYVPDDPKGILPQVEGIIDGGCRIFFYKIEVHRIFSVEIPQA